MKRYNYNKNETTITSSITTTAAAAIKIYQSFAKKVHVIGSGRGKESYDHILIVPFIA